MRSREAAAAGIAPGIQSAFEAIERLLADRDWHRFNEVVLAAKSTGAAERTARNIIDDLLRSPAWLQESKSRAEHTLRWIRQPELDQG